MRLILVGSFLIAFSVSAFSQGLEIEEGWWCPNGMVHAMAVDEENDILYLGGDFTMIGERRPFAVLTDPQLGIVEPNFVGPNDYVYCSVSDGNGGLFVGGKFTMFGDSIRNGLAQIDQFGQVTSWDPNVEGRVHDIKISEDIVFIGGSFDFVGGEERENLASVDKYTGELTSWDPTTDQQVNDLSISENTVYFAGLFSNVNGISRHRLAAVNKDSGDLELWLPDPVGSSSPIRTIVATDSSVYIGGTFTEIGGEARSNIAEVDKIFGAATEWAPDADAPVRSLIVRENHIYVGGSFNMIGGQPRQFLASIFRDSGLADSWTPNPDADVIHMSIDGQHLYVAGSFSQLSGLPRPKMAEISLSTGVPTNWSPPETNIYPSSISVLSEHVFIGGGFIMINGQPRERLAAINMLTGEATEWNPGANDRVNCLALDGITIYAGGRFSQIGFKNRNHIAALHTLGDIATSWNPNADNFVDAIDLNEDHVYVCGPFQNIGGEYRSNLAELNKYNNLATSWDPDAWGNVRDIEVIDDHLYAAGSFSNFGGQNRYRIAKVELSTYTVTDWNPLEGASEVIITEIGIKGNAVYVGGEFDSLIGSEGENLAKIDATTGEIIDWPIEINNEILALYSNGNTVYVGGDFFFTNTSDFNGLFSINTGSDQTSDWKTNYDGPDDVFCISGAGSKIFVGGWFNHIAGKASPNFAVISNCSEHYVDTQTAETEYTWIDGYTYTTDNNTATYVYTEGAENSCDSIVTLNLDLTMVNFNELGESLNYAVYPNPTDGPITIQFQELQEDLTIKVYDLYGKLISTKNVQNDNRVELKIEAANGVYFLRLSNDEQIFSSVKILKVK